MFATECLLKPRARRRKSRPVARLLLWGRSEMFAVEVYATVQRLVFIDGNSRRKAAQVFDRSRETLSKMCLFSLPPGYMRTKPAAKPKLGPLLAVIEAILEADRTAPVKQWHTAKRIFAGAPFVERLRDNRTLASALGTITAAVGRPSSAQGGNRRGAKGAQSNAS